MTLQPEQPEQSVTPVVEAPKPRAKRKKIEIPSALSGKYFYGLGRRKRAIAQVRLYVDMRDSAGGAVVNKKLLEDYFDTEEQRVDAGRPLDVTQLPDRFFISVQVKGGGKSGQADAVSMGIARALLAFDISLRGQLKLAGLLTRDPREKERKKIGLKRARKAPQYTKR
ncbi:MAG: 30S ribosomal protein S9 [bacterium]